MYSGSSRRGAAQRSDLQRRVATTYATSRLRAPSSRDGDYRLAHAARGAQLRLDLAQLDAEPAQLHLDVGASHELTGRQASQRTTSPVRYIRSPAARTDRRGSAGRSALGG